MLKGHSRLLAVAHVGENKVLELPGIKPVTTLDEIKELDGTSLILLSSDKSTLEYIEMARTGSIVNNIGDPRVSVHGAKSYFLKYNWVGMNFGSSYVPQVGTTEITSQDVKQGNVYLDTYPEES